MRLVGGVLAKIDILLYGERVREELCSGRHRFTIVVHEPAWASLGDMAVRIRSHGKPKLIVTLTGM